MPRFGSPRLRSRSFEVGAVKRALPMSGARTSRSCLTAKGRPIRPNRALRDESPLWRLIVTRRGSLLLACNGKPPSCAHLGPTQAYLEPARSVEERFRKVPGALFEVKASCRQQKGQFLRKNIPQVKRIRRHSASRELRGTSGCGPPGWRDHRRSFVQRRFCQTTKFPFRKRESAGLAAERVNARSD